MRNLNLSNPYDHQINTPRFLQASSSHLTLDEHLISQQHCFATTACLLASLEIFQDIYPKQDRLLRIINGLHAFLVYCIQYWTDYVLCTMVPAEGAALPRTPTLDLACKLAHKLDEIHHHKEKDVEIDFNISDARIEALKIYPRLQNHVKRAMYARSLEALEADFQKRECKGKMKR